ncbi:MAG: M50 family metallopeptidase [Planctomycetes bacterium]|nr:M50 family metallopeptidase [Planctomycetota bacterium]MBI3847662.1 M50 family metallopeptidase [Planctomycetota bacterium]
MTALVAMAVSLIVAYYRTDLLAFVGFWTLVSVFGALLVPFHELGHAIVGFAVGGRVHEITLGIGKPVFERSWRGVRLSVREVPSGGTTIVTQSKRRFFRLRCLLTTLGGPLVHVALLAGSIALLFGVEFFATRPVWVIVLGSFAVANLFLLGVSLWPKRYPREIGTVRSDGLGLFTAITLRGPRLEEHWRSHRIVRLILDMKAGRPKDARLAIEVELQRFPNDPILTFLLAVQALDDGEFVEARRTLLELSARPDLAPDHAARIDSFIASTDLQIGDPSLLAEADDRSLRAMNALGWDVGITATRGAVLVERGDVIDGLRLLSEAQSRVEANGQRAEIACRIAIGECKQGNLDAARRALAEARAADPDCHLLRRAEATVNPSG